MSSKKSSMRCLFGALAVTTCLLTGISATSWAQSNDGLTLFSGVRRENQLSYLLDYGGRPNGWDRYRLRIPAKKLELGVAQFAISYPDYFDGKFDTDKIEVRVKGKSVPLSEVEWDQENNLIQIYLEEPITAGNKVELVLSNVKNPPFGGTYYFNVQTLTPGDVPLPRYLGTWIISIGRG
jgi:hypothetical protein